MLSSARVRSPCDPFPQSVLTLRPSAAVAPGVVVLRIMDESELGLPGVLVTLEATGQSFVSDADGRVSLGPLMPGIHQLLAQKPGFGTVKAHFTTEDAAATGLEVEVEMPYGGMVY
jgi:hypothetical protein